MKKVLFLMLAVLSAHAHAIENGRAERVSTGSDYTKWKVTLPLSTTIDTEKLYDLKIIRILFDDIPDQLILNDIDVVDDKSKYADINIKMTVETNIPSSISGKKYITKMYQNDAFCTDDAADPRKYPQPDFVTVQLNGAVIQLNDEQSYPEFDLINAADGTRYSEHTVTLSFLPFEQVVAGDDPVVYCEGELWFSAELDI